MKFFKQKFQSLNDLISRNIKRFTGIIIRNNYIVGKFILNRILKPTINTTKYNMRSYVIFIKFLNKLHKTGGFKFLVSYLKGCSILLQQSVAGNKIPSQALGGAAIALTRQGLPRVIPSEMRSRIRARDAKVVRM